MVLSTLRTIGFDEALARVDEGARLVDLRDITSYLEVHAPGSLGLVYEFGPGMAGRARDCIPLSIPLILMESENANMLHAAASLRGKGFNVLGQVEGALNHWVEKRGPLASTELTEGSTPPTERVVDVGDPGRRRHEGSLDIPIELLWARTDEFASERSVTVLCGRALRAGLAIGILEPKGTEVRLWRKSGA